MDKQLQSVKAIFDQALEMSPVERKGYLDQTCATAPELRQKVDALLKAYDDAGSFLESPAANLPSPLWGRGAGGEGVGPTVDDPITERPGMVIGPYKLLEQIGEGGFGVVFLAEQQEPIRRKVALKVIKPGMDTRQVIARFEAERQALALMDHPNIAKVLDAGTTACVEPSGRRDDGDTRRADASTLASSTLTTGRPYFVMELVKGVPITEYCDQNQLTPRERLELFIPVCQAVQHAHQKGIIHRDIKPSNVMVTLHDGTPVVKVIDFGIAKAMGQQLTDKTLFTNFAQMIGTPLYMSPEQAGLSGLDVDTRSDIYSLGVLLYELLTGTTPFDKERFKEAGYDEIRRIIRDEEPPKPSTRISTLGQAATTVSTQRKSDPKRLSQLFRGELDWIVMKALEKDRSRRYETASALAADVQRYLHDEPVQACPPSAWYRLRKFSRRNRVAGTIAGLIFFSLVLLGSGIGWIVGDRAARRGKAAESFDDALTQARAFMKDENWPEAKMAAQRAAGLLSGAGGDDWLHQRLGQVEADLNMAGKLEWVRLQRAAVKDGHFDDLSADPLYAEAFRDYSLPVMELDADEAARRIAASAIREQLLAALVDWKNIQTDPAHFKKLAALVRLADDDPWRQQIRDAGDHNDRPRLARLAQRPETFHQSPACLVALGNILARIDLPAAVKFLGQAQQAHPDDFWLNHQLAFYLTTLKPPRLDEAIGFYRAAVALRPRSPGVHLNLGVALHNRGLLDEAIASHNEAIRLKPDYAMAHNNLGIALRTKGRLNEAITSHNEAIRLKPDYALAYHNLGIALYEKKDVKGSIRKFRAALQINPNSAEAHCGLGVALKDKGEVEDAIREFRAALQINPNSAEAHYTLGVALKDKGCLHEAIDEYREAIRLKKDYPEAHCNLGHALADKGCLEDAIAECREALRLNANLAEAHHNLGCALMAKGQLEEAIAEYREAIRLKRDFSEAHSNLGNALSNEGQLEEAIAEYREAIRLKKDYPGAHSNLGVALAVKGCLEDAIAEYREALRLNANLAEAHGNLGNALSNKGQLEEAVAEYREAIRLKKDFPEAHNWLGALLCDQKHDYDGAIAAFKNAIRLKPDFPEAHYNLGGALQRKGQLDEAIAEYRQAIHLKREFPEAHNNLGDTLMAKGQLDEAIAEFRHGIRLKKDDPYLHYNLGRALRWKGQLEEAIAEYRQAIQLKKDYPEAHCNLGDALVQQGQFRQAVQEIRLGHELGSRNPRWPHPSAQWLRNAERLAQLDMRLPKILKGEDRPADAAERVQLGWLCQQQYKQLNAAAARLYGEVFAADPKLAEDLDAGHRYNGACAAALASCGQGKDAGKLDEKERARLRQQAFAWLRADLAAWQKILNKEAVKARPIVQQTMQHWQQDADLAGVRGDALAKVPGTERQNWRKLWQEVEELGKRAADSKRQ